MHFKLLNIKLYMHKKYVKSLFFLIFILRSKHTHIIIVILNTIQKNYVYEISIIY